MYYNIQEINRKHTVRSPAPSPVTQPPHALPSVRALTSLPGAPRTSAPSLPLLFTQVGTLDPILHLALKKPINVHLVDPATPFMSNEEDPGAQAGDTPLTAAAGATAFAVRE